MLCRQFHSYHKEYLQTYIRFPQTQRIFLAGRSTLLPAIISFDLFSPGGSDNSYVSTIVALQNEGLLGKLTILEKAGGDQSLSRKFRLPTHSVDNLFMSRRLTPPPLVTPPPLNIIGLSPLNSSGGLPTPHSPGPFATINGKLIDPTLVGEFLLNPCNIAHHTFHSRYINVSNVCTGEDSHP